MRDKDYETLHSRYMIALARAQDLQEQLTTKQNQWAEREEQFATTEKITRELCENILAKDRDEMKLGKEYAWDNIPIQELVRKSITVHKNYVNSRKDLLSKIMDVAEKRRQELDGLKDQISVMKTGASQAVALKMDEIDSIVEAGQGQEPSHPGHEKQGNIHPNGEDISKMPKNTPVIAMDSDDDFSAIEEEMMQSMADKEKEMRIGPKSPIVTENQKRVRKKKQMKEKADAIHDVNIAEYEKNMDDTQWEIVKTMGEGGISVYKEIENKVLSEKPAISKNKVRVALSLLSSAGVIQTTKIEIPKGSCTICQLTDMGERIFKREFKSPPVKSEAARVKAEHDNFKHGYGILYCADLIRNSGYFHDVSEYNRKHPIHLEGCSDYIPDITCTGEDGNIMYIEYECANHSQANFNAKCQKMCCVTSTLNFIVPNREVEEEIKGQVTKWVENRGIASLEHVKVRITSAKQLKGRDIREDSGWKTVYILSDGLEPKTNF